MQNVRPGERKHNYPARFWVSPETDQAVRRIADSEGKTISDVYRELVEKGLVAGGYQSGSQDMAGLVRETVEVAMKPGIDRLASISAKAAQISAAAFFLAAYNGKLVLPDNLLSEYDDIMVKARKLGIEFVRLSKDKSLDEFIGSGLHRMGDVL